MAGEGVFESSVMISGCLPSKKGSCTEKRRGAITSISAAEDAHRIRHKPSEAIGLSVCHNRWRHTDRRTHDEVERHMDRRGSHHERVVGKDRRWVGELREVEVESGSCCGGSSNHHGVVGNGDGSHRDGGCIHGREVGHGRSSRRMVDSRRRLDGMVAGSESGSGRCEESRLGSVDGFSCRAD